MNELALAAAALCAVLAISLFARSLARLGVTKRLLARPSEGRARGPGWRVVRGVIEPQGAPVSTPFSEAPALWCRVSLRGVGPDGGVARVLWSKTIAAPSRFRAESIDTSIDLNGADVLVPRWQRQGSLRALVPHVRLVPRILSRVGYRTPPPLTQWFELEEEYLRPGESVIVIADDDGAGKLRGTAAQPLVVSNLTRGRIFLRAAWGPVLGGLLALLALASGALVLATALWLR